MRTCILLIALLYALTGTAQNRGIEIGLTSAVGLLPSLNYAVDLYNDTRPWLDNKLDHQALHNGFTIGTIVFTDDDRLSFRPFTINQRWQRSVARGTTPLGEDIVRRVRVRYLTTQIMDATYYPIRSGLGRIGVGLSPIDISFLGIKTKLNDEKWTDNVPDIARAGFIPDLYLGVTFHLDFVLGGSDADSHLIGQLYAHLNYVGEADVIWVNDAINGPLASTFPMRQSERLQHVGFKLLVTL